MTQGIIAILILGTIFFGTAAIIIALFWGIRLVRGNSPHSSPQQQREEVKTVQEIYKGLSKMEKRIETLETLLFEQQRKEAGREPK
jgi:flagellar basal body-associated protein FliL